MSDLNIKKIQPTKGYVLVEPAKSEEKTSSGIILPENEAEKPQHGVVLAVGAADSCCGDDCCDSDGCCDSKGCGEGAGCCETDNHGCESGHCEPSEHKSKESKVSKEMKEDGCCGGSCACGCDDDCCSDSCCDSAPVKVGDKVIYKKWGGNDFKIGDTEYQFLKFEDILAVVSK